MTNDLTLQLKLQRERQEHEMKVAILNAFAADPELKYYVGMAAGSGIALISEMFKAGFDSTTSSTTTPSATSPIPWLFILSPGLVGTPIGQLGLASWLYDKEASTPDNMPSTVSGIVTLASTGFAGFCCSILLLKAIFGEKGATGILGALGTAGVV